MTISQTLIWLPSRVLSLDGDRLRGPIAVQSIVQSVVRLKTSYGYETNFFVKEENCVPEHDRAVGNVELRRHSRLS